jgi:hypothetical protein
MPVAARPSILRKVLEEQFSLLAGELVALYEQELASREVELVESVRGELTEGLNQAVRRLRQADDFQQISGVLVDSSVTHCRLLAVLAIHDATVRAIRVRGLGGAAAERFGGLEFPAAEAAAFSSAIESGDPVVAMTTPREISPGLVEILGHTPEERAYILPILVRGKPAGLIYASGAVEMAPLELLAQTAALALEVKMGPPEVAHNSDLVMIQGGRPAPSRQIPDSWAELSTQDQELHLRAQRFARVNVAGMRLFSPDAVQQGRKSKDLYARLQQDIDAGREMFRQNFLAESPNMLDYFHLELLRTLANDDASLLGEKYPGPMV